MHRYDRKAQACVVTRLGHVAEGIPSESSGVRYLRIASTSRSFILRSYGHATLRESTLQDLIPG